MLLFRVKETSSKWMILLFALMVVRSPLYQKIQQISFFMFAVSLGCGVSTGLSVIYVKSNIDDEVL